MRALAKSQASNATATLIAHIKDSDSDVRGAALSALQGRQFDDGHITQLGALLGDPGWDVRRTAANFLGTTSSERALNLLTDRLVVETDNDVQAALRAAIQAVRGRIGH
jgi:HEAT repeat protein